MRTRRTRALLMVLLMGGLLSAMGVVIITEASAAESATGTWTKPISIGSGAIGGTHHVVMTGIAGLITKYMHINATAEATAWGGVNVDLLKKKEIELSSLTSDAAYEGWEGKGYFKGATQRFMRLIHTGYSSCGIVVARSDSGIKTLADLKGKRFYAWMPTSPIIQNNVNVIMEANGLTRSNFKLMDMVSNQEAQTALIERRADAALFGGSIIAAAVIEITNTIPCTIVPLGAAEMQVIKKSYPFFFPLTIPANTYKGQTEEKVAFGVKTHIIGRADLPDELIYQVTKTIMEHPAEVGAIHPAAKEIVLKNFAVNPQLPFHPGAIKYYKEKGVWTDDLQKAQDRLIAGKR